MATMINTNNDSQIEQEILGTMNLYANAVKNLQQFRGENPLEMTETRMREYVKAQRKATKAELEMYEYERMYASFFRKVIKTFKIK